MEHPRQVAGRGAMVVRFLLSILLLFIAGWVVLNRQYVMDQLAVWSYQPTTEVSQLVAKTSMSDEARFYFYASNPQINDRQEFNKSCKSVQTEKTAVLGCYSAQQIHLFDIEDERLEGIVEVTAAHEMLHAAYERLDNGERQRVDALLTQEADSVTDPDFRALIQEYEKTNPAERTNELHSIIGTQIPEIDDELEAYYGRYFKDRQAVIGLYEQYNEVFAELSAEQDRLIRELNTIAANVKAEQQSYEVAVATFNAEADRFNRAAQSGNMSRQEFNDERSRLVGLQNQLVQQRNNINQQIDQYNQLRNRLLAINTQVIDLNQAINSTLTPVEGVE